MEGKLVAEFNKNSLETIRVQFSEFKGEPLLDIRTWIIREGEADIPTKKGISLKLDQVGELARGILKALEEIEKDKKI